MNKFLIGLSFLLIVLGSGISIYFFCSLSTPFDIAGQGELKMDVTGQVGDFIGGIVGTLFALSGTFLIYLSFREQTNQNKREAFEAAFFEMLRLHRENVTEMNYMGADNRKVFVLIYKEFFECFREVNKFYRATDDFILPKYERKLKRVIQNINPGIDIKEMAMIDIAYSIVFFGVGKEGMQVLRNRFRQKYTETHTLQLVTYLRLKPENVNDYRFKNFSHFKEMPVNQLRLKMKELYDHNRGAKITDPTLSKDELISLSDTQFVKYYGGQQFRLGHYFRHLFQTYKYLHYNSNLNKTEKYFYGKTLRAQLSTYEQALLFINSISSLGMKWEFTAEYKGNDTMSTPLITMLKRKNHLISIYNLIKNLPGQSSFGFKYRTYYPEVNYESEE